MKPAFSLASKNGLKANQCMRHDVNMELAIF